MKMRFFFAAALLAAAFLLGFAAAREKCRCPIRERYQVKRVAEHGSQKKRRSTGNDACRGTHV